MTMSEVKVLHDAAPPLSHARRSFLDDELQAKFAKDGFVIVRLLDPAEADDLLGKIRSICPDELVFGDMGHVTHLSIDKVRAKATQDLIIEFMSPRLARYLDDHTVTQASYICRPPGASRMLPHLHPTGSADFLDTVVLSWCPLIDVHTGNGALQIVPGSHKLLWHVKTLPSPFYWADADHRIIDKNLTTPSLKAGEAILFDNTLVHASCPNNTPHPRPIAVGQSSPRGSIDAFYVDPIEPGGDVEIFRARDAFSYADLIHDRMPPRETWERIGTMPPRRVQLNQEQFEALLANGIHIAPGVDPYEMVAHLANSNPMIHTPVRPRPLWRRAVGKARRLAKQALWGR